MAQENREIRVNMNADQFIKYMDRNKIKLSNKQIEGVAIVTITLIFGIILLLYIESLYAPAPEPMEWSGILKFLVISAGLGWILHGTGFIIVRR